MDTYEKNLHISDEAFDSMRNNADRVLQRLIKNMIEKDSMEGKLTITIDVALTQEFIPNKDPHIEGETRRILSPKFSHKVGSVMQIKNEEKGNKNYDGMELVWDEATGEYILKPVANTDQMTIFDADFRCVNDPEDTDVVEEEQLALEGKRVASLPGPAENSADEIVDAEDIQEEMEVEDMSDEFEDIYKEPLPFSEGDEDDEYGYEEPEDDF